MEDATLPTQRDEPIAMIEALRDAGWSVAFDLDRHGLSWGDHRAPTTEFGVARSYRFEGESDPADEAIVLAIEHLPSRTTGFVHAAFGPAATSEQAAVLRSLAHDADRR
jgi:hypothetical protein